MMARSDVTIHWGGRTTSKVPVSVTLSSLLLEDLEAEIEVFMLMYPPEDHGTVAGGITDAREHGHVVHLMTIPALDQDITKCGLLAQPAGGRAG